MLQTGDSERYITHIAYDSRYVVFPKTSLFLALKGSRHDGHAHLADAYQKGIRCFIVSQQIDNQLFKNATILFVPDVTLALQALVKYHRQQFELPVIGITGSNGKTTIKEWLSQLMAEEFAIVKSPKSFNSQLGVPLSVWQLQAHHNLGIFEAGVSTTNEMATLRDVIQPTIGILTNIGNAHDAGFEDKSQKKAEKMLLFEHVKTLILKATDAQKISKNVDIQYFTWKYPNEDFQATLCITAIEHNKHNTHIKAEYLQQNISITIPFIDAVSLENAIHCWCVMLQFGYDSATIRARMLQLQTIALRLELKAAINDCVLINDSYNADLTSLTFALNFMAQQRSQGRHTVVLSDILQSGLSPKHLYQSVADLLNVQAIQRVIAIGKDIDILKKYLNQNIDYQHFATTNDFLNQVNQDTFRNETILLKGARNFEFERIATRLSLKAHKTVMEVNLNALRHNLNTYTQYLNPGTKLLAMVKAYAYGSGSAEVAKLLEFLKIDYLGVAYTDEGVAIRKEGVTLPILVLNPEETTFEALVRYRLEPEIYSLSQAQSLFAYVSNIADFKVHIKLDTGMHRLGFEPHDLQRLMDLLAQNPNIRVASIFSHLAGSEANIHDDFTAQQFHRFSKMATLIVQNIGYQPIRHILNSGGINRHTQYQLDMVRLGIGLYGIDSSQEIQQQLQLVNTLKATISQIKTIPVGETIGYGRRGVAHRTLRIATISIGYADGLLRRAGNGNYSVAICGQLAPIVGGVCMDMTMVDITDIADAREGDEVIVFGHSPSVEMLAKALDTIPYEIFTSISTRVKRVYFQE